MEINRQIHSTVRYLYFYSIYTFGVCVCVYIEKKTVKTILIHRTFLYRWALICFVEFF